MNVYGNGKENHKNKFLLYISCLREKKNVR